MATHGARSRGSKKPKGALPGSVSINSRPPGTKPNCEPRMAASSSRRSRSAFAITRTSGIGRSSLRSLGEGPKPIIGAAHRTAEEGESARSGDVSMSTGRYESGMPGGLALPGTFPRGAVEMMTSRRGCGTLAA